MGSLKQTEYTLDQIYELLEDPKNNLQTKIPYSHLIKTNGKTVNITIGKLWFNTLLPSDYPLVDYVVAKKDLVKILTNIAIKYEPSISCEVLSRINKEGFKLTTLRPTTFSPDSFNIPPSFEKRRKELLDPNLPADKFVENIKIIGQEYLDYLKVTDDGLYNIMASGARGEGALGTGVILFAKGPVVGIDGVISKPILGCVNNGLKLEDWYKSSDQSRGVLFLRAIATAEPGSLAREVFFANANTQLDFNSDCKTKKYLTITLKPSIRAVINGRYYENDNGVLEKITADTVFSTPSIRLRSPIYCKQKDANICSICYGDLGEKLNTRNIGLLSGSVINVQGVNNYSMKQRHQSSQVQVARCNFIEQMIRV